MKKALLPALAVVSLAAIAFAAVQSRNANHQQARVSLQQNLVTEARAELQATKVELERARKQNEVLATESEALRQKLAVQPAAAGSPGAQGAINADGTTETPPTSDGSDSKSGGASFAKNWSKMFADPEMRKGLRAQQGMGIRMIYGDFIKEAGLEPTEVNALYELLTDRQMAMAAKGMESMNDLADPEKAEAAGKAIAASQEDYTKKLANLLGPEREQKLKDYERTSMDRMSLQQMTQQFASSGSPLGEPQRQSLLKIMTEERLRTPESPLDPSAGNMAKQMDALGNNDAVARMMESQRSLNKRVRDRAHGLLTPNQLQTLETSQNQMIEMQEAGIKMSRAMMGK